MTAQPVGAIVMGADYRGLGIVRSLGRRGIPVCVLKHGDQLLAAFSRYARQSLAWPGLDDAERVRFLLHLASRQGLEGWVLFPTDDETVLLVARHHQVLAEHFRLTTPSWDQVRWAVDKRLMRQLALELGVDHPWTYLPRSREDLRSADRCRARSGFLRSRRGVPLRGWRRVGYAGRG